MNDVRRRIVSWALLAVAGVASLASCGIPTDSAPRVLADTPATAPAVSAPVNSADSATIYLGTGEAEAPLVAVDRGLDGVPDPERVLSALLVGPTTDDLAKGLSTFIPVETELLGVELEGDLLAVDLTQNFYTGEGAPAASAFAQVVLTATDLAGYGIYRVQFQRDGEPIRAFTANGSGTKEVVTRSDYRSIDPE